VFTNKRVLFRAGWLSPLGVVYAAVMCWALVESAISVSWVALLLVVTLAGLLVQRRPHQWDIPFEDLVDSRIASAQGIAGEVTVLILVIETGSVQLVTARDLPERVKRLIKCR
jgi:hypothetical protein